ICIYDAEGKTWMPLLVPVASKLSGDSCEWEFDSATARVFLVRGYPLGDSVFYTTDTRKFVFSDRTMNTNSLGDDFPITSFPGKYYFKATASRFTDSSNANPTMLTANFEVDSSGINSFFRGMSVATVNNPKNTQTLDQLSSLQIATIHAGQDSLFALQGVTNSTTINGNGPTTSVNAFLNSTAIANNATQNVGSLTGIRNSLSNASPISKVTGNVFGYNGSVFMLDTLGTPMVNGNVYGVFLSNIMGAAPKRNYAFYSNKGHNRFADSTLITDGFFTSPRAVLDINSTSAMITPAGTTAQRPSSPITAMFRYNTTGSNMEFYNGTTWKSLAGDTSEWVFNNITNRVNLVRGLPKSDTIFYSPVTRQFVFSDRYTNTNSTGMDFPVDFFKAKYTFKSTASQRLDTFLTDGAVANFVYEIDNAKAGTFFNTLSSSAVINPKAFHKTDQVLGFSNTTIHAGNDSAYIVMGISNIARNSGNGKSEEITGISNSARILNGVNNNTGTMFGIRNSLGISGTSGGRVTSNVYGIFNSFSGFTNNVDGTIYGVYVGTVTGAAPKKNYAFYSFKGHNRYGDSTLITDGSAISPRAVLDVNSTSAMIIPVGTTAQRPAAPVQGMLRYNTTHQTVEAYTGAQWNGILRWTASIDVPNIAINAGITISVIVTNATVGSVVSISPASAPTAGLVIAWARVSAANTVEIRFENNAAVAINPPLINYEMRLIQ
ncbi:MAG TPA: hypothetical protein VHM26_19210, partial [Chitinophagaceae bacterium]|nr:hypothetical protein [Chitinophagaceae bacterium]